MTWQYFFMDAKSFSSCFLPSSSCHLLQYLVKAFFLDLYLFTSHARAEARRGEHRHTTGWRRPFVAARVRGRDRAGCAPSPPRGDERGVCSF